MAKKKTMTIDEVAVMLNWIGKTYTASGFIGPWIKYGDPACYCKTSHQVIEAYLNKDKTK